LKGYVENIDIKRLSFVKKSKTSWTNRRVAISGKFHELNFENAANAANPWSKL
jgi:hypothetical protein